MTFREEDVRKLALLAHVGLDAAEITRAATDLDALLAYIAQLEAIDVGDASEAVHVGPRAARLRPDIVRPGLPREVLTRDAPSAAYGLFEVPRVVSRGPSAGGDGPAGSDGLAGSAPGGEAAP